MSILPTWPIAAGTLIIGVVLGAGGAVTIKNAKIDRIVAAHGKEIADWKSAQAKALENNRLAELKYRSTEQEMRESAGRNLEVKQNEINRITGQRDAALAGLQNRPARPAASPGTVPAASASCKGATGADLFRDDASLVVREAARADQIRAALAQCYSQYDAARGSLAPAVVN